MTQLAADRRTFLKGLLTVAASALIPTPALPSYPVLHGDGVHDDTIALQALFDGKRVVVEDQVVDPTAGRVWVIGKMLRVTQTITIRPDSPSKAALMGVSIIGDFTASVDRPVVLFLSGSDTAPLEGMSASCKGEASHD